MQKEKEHLSMIYGAEEIDPEDLISRHLVLKALEWKWAGKGAIDAIKTLPSVISADKER